MKRASYGAALALGLALALAGCGGEPEREPGTDQLAAELAEVKAERDQARAALATAQQEATSAAGQAVKDPNYCRLEIQVTAENVEEARAYLTGKKPADATGKNALESVENALATLEQARDYCGEP